MAKQIKVIKCPQCGNSKPESIGNEHYRCDKCGTEFFLDNDDVNINVNHRHETMTGKGGSFLLKGFFGCGFMIFFIIVIMLVARFCVGQSKPTERKAPVQRTVETSEDSSEDGFFSTMLSVNGQGVAFSLSNRRRTPDATFRNIATGELIKEQKLIEPFTTIDNVEHRKFENDSTNYIIVNKSHICKIDPVNCTFTDITAEICARKPAINEGLKSVLLFRGYTVKDLTWIPIWEKIFIIFR